MKNPASMDLKVPIHYPTLPFTLSYLDIPIAWMLNALRKFPNYSVSVVNFGLHAYSCASYQSHGYLTLAEICLTYKRIKSVAGVVRFRPIAYCGSRVILRQYMSAV